MVSYTGLNPIFAARISAAIADAEKATGGRAVVNSAYRTYGEQAQLWNQSTGYGRHAKSFAVASPGKSLHEQGMAFDLAKGPVRDWIEAHAAQYGLEPASSKRGWGYDPPHIQLARGTLKTAYDSTPNAFAEGGRKLPGVPVDPFGVVMAKESGALPSGGKARTLRKGMTGPDVERLQTALASHALYGGPIDGKFGRQTQAAVRNAESMFSLPTRDKGVAGPQIQAALGFGPPAAAPGFPTAWGAQPASPQFPAAWGEQPQAAPSRPPIDPGNAALEMAMGPNGVYSMTGAPPMGPGLPAQAISGKGSAEAILGRPFGTLPGAAGSHWEPMSPALPMATPTPDNAAISPGGGWSRAPVTDESGLSGDVGANSPSRPGDITFAPGGDGQWTSVDGVDVTPPASSFDMSRFTSEPNAPPPPQRSFVQALGDAFLGPASPPPPQSGAPQGFGSDLGKAISGAFGFGSPPVAAQPSLYDRVPPAVSPSTQAPNDLTPWAPGFGSPSLSGGGSDNVLYGGMSQSDIADSLMNMIDGPNVGPQDLISQNARPGREMADSPSFAGMSAGSFYPDPARPQGFLNKDGDLPALLYGLKSHPERFWDQQYYTPEFGPKDNAPTYENLWKETGRSFPKSVSADPGFMPAPMSFSGYGSDNTLIGSAGNAHIPGPSVIGGPYPGSNRGDRGPWAGDTLGLGGPPPASAAEFAPAGGETSWNDTRVYGGPSYGGDPNAGYGLSSPIAHPDLTISPAGNPVDQVKAAVKQVAASQQSNSGGAGPGGHPISPMSYGGSPSTAGYGFTGFSPWGSATYGAPYGQTGYSNSPYTPMGYTAPNFNSISGGPTYAYQPNGQGGGSYVDSHGNVHSY